MAKNSGFKIFLWSALGVVASVFLLGAIANISRDGNGLADLFSGKYVKTSDKAVALVDNYFENIQKTQYSGTTVTTVEVYANKDGNLEIGTAPIGVIGEAETSLYEVEKGKNVITLEAPLRIEADETLIVGGGKTTVDLRKTDKKSVTFGAITELEDGVVATDFKLLDQTLEIDVDASYIETTSGAVFDSVVSDLGAIADQNAMGLANMPFVYQNLTLYENSTITKIGVPIRSITDYAADSILTVYVVGIDSTLSSIEVISENKLTIPANTYSSNTINEWYYFDVNITVGNNQTLAFCNAEDSVLSVSNQAGLSQYSFYKQVFTSISVAVSNIYFDVYRETTNAYTLEEYVELLDYENTKALLAGKNFSLLGASICTYEGWSNNTEANSTIGNNVARYPEQDVTSVDDTWWKQTADNTKMNVLVTNTWRGTYVSTANGTTNAGCMTRCQNLHDDVGDNAGTMPDVIAIYIGTNDFNHNVTLGTFEKLSDIYDETTGEYVGDLTQFAVAYATMIHKIQTAYPNARIFNFTHLQNNTRKDYEALEGFNDAIRYASEYFDCELVDIYNDSGINAENLSVYTSDGLHPLANGMDLISDCFEKALIKAYKE